MIDARISVGLPSHPKTKKLIKKAGTDAAWRLVCLFLWVAQNHSDGNLDGLSAEDIELTVDWPGEEGAFVNALISVGFIDLVDGSYVIHDWREHNPWAAHADERADRARFAGLCSKRGRAFAEHEMPEYAEKLRQLEANKKSNSVEPNQTNSSTNSQPIVELDSTTSQLTSEVSSTPSPSPSPSPSPKAKHLSPGGDPDTVKAIWESGKRILGDNAGSLIGMALKKVGDLETMAALEQANGKENPTNAFAASVRTREAKIRAAGESAKPKLFDPNVLSL